MKNYGAKRTSTDVNTKRNEYTKKSRAGKPPAEDKAKRDEYNK